MTNLTHIRIIIFTIAVCLVAALLVPLSVDAQGTFVPLSQGIEKSQKLNGLFSSGDLRTFVERLFIFALSIGAILAVIRIMYAGYLYMGHGDMWGSLSKAKEIIADTVLGLLLLLAIYIILYQINPQILQINILNSMRGQTTTAPAPSAFTGAPVPYTGTAGSISGSYNGIPLCTAGGPNGTLVYVQC